MKIITLIFLLLMSVLAFANSNCELDLNGDGICDAYSITKSNDDALESTIAINVGGGSKTISGRFELGDGGVSDGYIPGDFSLLVDFHTRDVNMTKYNFRWVPTREDWVLYKKSTWNEPSRDEKYSLGDEKTPNEALFPKDFDVQRIACCTFFSEFSDNSPDVKLMGSEERLIEVKKDFKYVLERLKQGEKSQLFYAKDEAGKSVVRSIPKDFVYEMTLILSDDNVGSLNDYAYYLYKIDNNIMAIYLLREIVNKYPKRVVAKLNLADAYWKVGMESDACPLYKEYVGGMTAAGKTARIPSQATLRASCK